MQTAELILTRASISSFLRESQGTCRKRIMAQLQKQTTALRSLASLKLCHHISITLTRQSYCQTPQPQWIEYSADTEPSSHITLIPHRNPSTGQGATRRHKVKDKRKSPEGASSCCVFRHSPLLCVIERVLQFRQNYSDILRSIEHRYYSASVLGN